jgi:hypothetical protein
MGVICCLSGAFDPKPSFAGCVWPCDFVNQTYVLKQIAESILLESAFEQK